MWTVECSHTCHVVCVCVSVCSGQNVTNKSKGTLGPNTRNSRHGKRLKRLCCLKGLAPPVDNKVMPHPTTAVRVLILQLVDNPTERLMVNIISIIILFINRRGCIYKIAVFHAGFDLTKTKREGGVGTYIV